MAPNSQDEEVFRTRDPEGRLVALYRDTWENHIRDRHPGTAVDWIQAVVESPDAIVWNPRERSFIYVTARGRKRFRLVAAKLDKGKGERSYLVSTAYPTGIPPAGQGTIIWQRPLQP